MPTNHYVKLARVLPAVLCNSALNIYEQISQNAVERIYVMYTSVHRPTRVFIFTAPTLPVLSVTYASKVRDFFFQQLVMSS